MEIIRISVLGLAGIFLAVLLKDVHPDYGTYVIMASGILILFFSVGKLSYLLDAVRSIQRMIPVDATYVNILLKMAGITYIGQFASGICKDAGYSSVASQIQIFGKLSVMAVSMPVVVALLETIHEFLL